uniref:ABC transporter protein n=1 Tax=Sorangium cellulosum TaxID=56 RepID=I0J6Z0_SORCE|nr:ABC transporter protein [Sorangium cellulosum]
MAANNDLTHSAAPPTNGAPEPGREHRNGSHGSSELTVYSPAAMLDGPEWQRDSALALAEPSTATLNRIIERVNRPAEEHVKRAIPKWETRARDIHRIVSKSLKDRRERLDLLDEIREAAVEGAVRSMPRRKIAKAKITPPLERPVFKPEYFNASVWRTLARCFVWTKLFWLFQLSVLWDKILRRDTMDRRAKRILTVFQKAGGSFIKIGQQLSMRIDLLPEEYCRELAKLLDAVLPFPSSEAVKAVERATGKPIAETFLLFDPTPIGSASIACVYQAVLKNGDKVAVKVRRPGIGTVFATDLRAIGWVMRVMETLAIVRPGLMQNFVREFASTIMEELDFRMEAYHQAIFLRESRKNNLGKKRFFTAPKLYYELSNEEVIVEEFAGGMWMWEILAAVESNDPVAFARMRELNIDPQVVAKRLLWVQFWSLLVSPMFHADPHPANIVVQQDSKLVFIDFGACGTLSVGKRELFRDVNVYQIQKDIVGVVRATLSFMEPLPPIDINQFQKELELEFAPIYQRIWSKKAPWYEKTTASVYMKLFAMTRKYNVPVNLDTVRSFRANMLYDTLALRIFPELDVIRENRKFLRDVNRNAKRQAMKGLRKRLSEGLISGQDLQAIQDMQVVGRRMMNFVRQYMGRPIFNYAFTIEKSVFAVMEIVKLLVAVSVMTAVVFVAIAIPSEIFHDVREKYRDVADVDIEFARQQLRELWDSALLILLKTLRNRAYQIMVVLMTLVTVRRIMLRLSDQEVEHRR